MWTLKAYLGTLVKGFYNAWYAIPWFQLVLTFVASKTALNEAVSTKLRGADFSTKNVNLPSRETCSCYIYPGQVYVWIFSVPYFLSGIRALKSQKIIEGFRNREFDNEVHVRISLQFKCLNRGFVKWYVKLNFKWRQIVSKDTNFCQMEVNYSKRSELIPNSENFDSEAVNPCNYINYK